MTEKSRIEEMGSEIVALKARIVYLELANVENELLRRRVQHLELENERRFDEHKILADTVKDLVDSLVSNRE